MTVRQVAEHYGAEIDEIRRIIRNSTHATLFREEAERARRYAAAMIDKKVIDRSKRDRRAL